MSADSEKEKSTVDMAKNKDDQVNLTTKSDDKKDASEGSINSSIEEKANDNDKGLTTTDKRSKSSEYDKKSTNEENTVTNENDEKDNKKIDGKSSSITKTNKSGEKTNDIEKKHGMCLSEIAKINENINKTRVEGLQILHMICFENTGKFNTVKKNLRKFSGFEFDIGSYDYKEKLISIEKHDIKLLKGVCDVLELEKKGSKEEIAETILKFLIAPEGEQEQEQEEEVEEELSDEDRNKKRKRSNAQAMNTKNTSGRPKRATAGKSNRDFSSYVDYSSEDSDHGKAPVSKRRKRKNDSDSGSDYNPSGGGSESDTGRKRQITRQSGRGRPARKSRRRNSDEDDSATSEEESDEPKRKRIGKTRGRPPTRGRRSAKKEESESEEEEEEEDEDDEEEEESEVGSEESEDEPKSKKSKVAGLRNSKHNNKSRVATSAKPGRPKKSTVTTVEEKPKKNESSEEAEDYKEGESEDEPLSKKNKPTPPTDEEIKGYVKEILDEANLEEITMKTVCKQVYAKYPDFDLTDKKDFIKATVKSLIAA